MATPQPPRKVFYLIALLLPVLLLLVLEMLLRVSPWYQRYPLFIASESLPGYLQTNPDLIKRYFADPKQAPDLAARHAGNGIALDNIRERLQLFFDLEARLEAVRSDGRYRVTIRLPFRRKPDAADPTAAGTDRG